MSSVARDYDWSVFTDTELEKFYQSHYEMADENDEYGGHVGISRHHRRQARIIGDELKNRSERREKFDSDVRIDA